MFLLGLILLVVGLCVGFAIPRYGPPYGNWGYGPGAILVIIGLVLIIWAALNGQAVL